MRNLFAVIFGLILGLMLFACVAKQRNILESSESQVKLRSIQSRVYDTADRDHMLRTIIATLQDLGFVIDDADKDLGTVSGTKRSGYFLRMTVSIRPRGERQTLVRSNAQYNLMTVEDPEPYQTFFSSLSKALFLEAQLVEAPGAGGAKEIKQVAMSTESPKESQKLTTVSKTSSTAKLAGQPHEAQQLASIPEDSPGIRVSLRRQPKAIRNQLEIRSILAEYNFFEISMNTHGSFANDLIDNNDGTLTDNATGLMWQKGGSSELLDNRGAKNYIKQINSQRFAGYSDWRMPTIEELMSLLNRYKNNGVYIAPQFSNQQTTCWSVDQTDYESGAWIVNFSQGEVREARWRSSYSGGSLAPGSLGSVHKNNINHIKAVRSLK